MAVKEKRTTTVHDRFEVSCSYCGRLAGEKSRAEGISAAKHYRTLHNGPNERVTVYDLMAHIGCTQVWDADGDPAGRRILCGQ
jgi:hypothetical protein